jgi:hypothetical protein
MTDARFPDRWLLDARLQRVTPAAFRAFSNALMWAVSNRTDGHIPSWAIDLIPHLSEVDAKELAEAELWAGHETDGWVIAEFLDTQSSRDELDALARRRRSDRIRKARSRAAKAQADALSRDVSRDSHAERVRTGQARQGQDVQKGTVTDPWEDDPGSGSPAPSARRPA